MQTDANGEGAQFSSSRLDSESGFAHSALTATWRLYPNQAIIAPNILRAKFHS